MTTWTVGQVVVARDSCQGMTRGTRYVVEEVRVRRTFAGGFTSLDLRVEGGDARVVDVGNPHLVLEAAS